MEFWDKQEPGKHVYMDIFAVRIGNTALAALDRFENEGMQHDRQG